MGEKSNKQKVIQGISSQTLVTIVLGVVEIASFSFMSRLLTKDDFGYYAAISAIVVVFASFSETGIGSAIVQCKDLTKSFRDNAFTLSLLFGISISGVLFTLAGIIARTVADGSMTIPLMLMSLTLLLNCLTSVFFSLMLRQLQFLRIGAINLFSLVITTIVAIWLAYAGYGYYAIITKAVLQSFITFALAWYFCKTTFSLVIDKRTSAKIFRFSGWLMASVLFRNLAHQIDRLLMPNLLTVGALGSYNRPKEFIEQVSGKLNGIFDSALFPVLSSIQDEKEKLARALSLSLSLLNVFSMLLSLTFSLNSRLVIRVFFGEEWMSLNVVTIILSFVLIFNIDGRLSDCYLRSMGMTREQFYFRIFEAVLNILGVIVSYQFGIVGVAISMVITSSTSKLIKIIFIANKVSISPLGTINIILKSWSFAFFLVPICLCVQFLLPDTLFGDLLQALLFAICVFCIFVCFPNLVGESYKEVVYVKLMSLVRDRLLSKRF